jgi:hypothetical protein
MAITAAQWKRAVLPVITDADAWGFRNKIAYRRPVNWVLLGVFGEGSGWNRDGVYVYTLVMPLFIPAEHLVLSYSSRVRPAGTFGLEDGGAFATAIRSAVDALPTESEALRLIASRAPNEDAASAASLLDQADEQEVARLRAIRDSTGAALGVL